MKRIFALTLAFLLLFLCSCSDKGDVGEETTTAELQATTENTATTIAGSSAETEHIIPAEWNSDILPEDFPPPPGGTHDIIIEQNEANNNYASDWVSIQFTCPENEIYRFTNDLLKAGYIGGAKKIDSPAQYYKAGFNGSWHNGKNLIRVAASQYDGKGEVTVVVDITECKDNFPAVLTTVFPKFNGFSKSTGLYSEYDDNRNRITNDFPGSLNAKSWTWDFGFENAFIGVTEEELEAYIDLLVNTEFAGQSSTSITDGCTVISYDLVKETEDCVYGVFIAYNQILKTLDILYTNNAYLYISQ